MLPLYELPETPRKSLDTNMGLWFERFFNQFDDDANEILESKSLNGELIQGTNFWLQKLNNAGNTDALRQAACRQMNLVKQLNGRYKFFNTQWHFVTGTGYPHPVENGLSWHRTHGVPYLSGAAVKGLVRAWVEEWEYAAPDDETEEEKKTREAKKHKHLLSWFGSESKQNKTNQAGDIIFFDALPVKEVQLVTDIMTPHQGEWYSNGGKIKNVATEPEKVPADWHDPIPIPFLVVDKATSYLFSVAPRNAQTAERVDMNCVICCLTNALEWLGAGAKTATGYGGFIEHNNHPLEKQCKAANQSLAEELELMTPEQLINAFSRDYNATKARFEQKGHDWQQVIELICQSQSHKESIESWKASKDKNPKKAYKNLTQYSQT
jgi:CRISPR-associated protein Cmr6